MTERSRGDVVLVRYQPFPEGDETWLRPAVVVSSKTYQQGREQLLLAAITGNQRPPQPGDTVIHKWQEAGLVGPSLVTGVLLTVTQASVEKLLGTLGPQDTQNVESSLRLSLGV